MSRKVPDTKIVGTRLSVELEARAQSVAKELSRRASGVPITLSAAMNIIVAKGLAVVEEELGLNVSPVENTSAKTPLAPISVRQQPHRESCSKPNIGISSFQARI